MMEPTRRYSADELLAAVRESIGAVAPDLGAVDSHTCLVGAEAILDSVGFVTLLVTLEQRLGNAVDLASSFIEQAGTPETSNPFRNVGALVDHLQVLMSPPLTTP